MRHHGKHPWAQPADRPLQTWVIVFDAGDLPDQIFEGPRAEGEAFAAYETLSLTLRCTLLSTVQVRPPVRHWEMRAHLGPASIQGFHESEADARENFEAHLQGLESGSMEGVELLQIDTTILDSRGAIPPDPNLVDTRPRPR